MLGGLFRIVHTAGSVVQQRTWVYDARGFLVSESSPERVSLVELGAYDAGGNAGSRTVAGATLDFAFDRAGRLLTVTRPLGGGGNELLQQFAYDTAPGYGLGRIASATDWTRFTGAAIAEAQVTEAFEYSGVGGNASLKTTTVALDSTTAASTTQSYLWSASGALAELGYPAGMSAGDPARTVTHQYTNGFLTAIPGFASSFTYHDNLALASVAHTNGVTDWIGQDPSRMLRPAALWTSGVVGGEDWNSGAYGYDGSGNIRAIGGQRYRYDGVSRLVEAELRIPETNATLFGVESFTYDAYGNLTSRNTTEGGSTSTVNSPADPATNRLTGATSYDTEGNLTSWNGAQYGFDPLGRMVRMQNGAEDWLFAYSTGGERVLQVAQAGAGEKRWTVRDVSGRVLREWTEASGGSPVWDRDWVYRGGQLLATVDASTTRHLTLDHLGSPRLVTDQAGAKLAFHAYWPYGREATDPNQDPLGKKFTGHERDNFGTVSTADDLDYMHARYGVPAMGRFAAIDSHSLRAAGPHAFNRYTYAMSNPSNLVDPDGRVAILATIAGGAAIGGVVGAGSQLVFNLISGNGPTAGLGTAFLSGLVAGAVAGTGYGFAAWWAGGTLTGAQGAVAGALSNGAGGLVGGYVEGWMNGEDETTRLARARRGGEVGLTVGALTGALATPELGQMRGNEYLASFNAGIINALGAGASSLTTTITTWFTLAGMTPFGPGENGYYHEFTITSSTGINFDDANSILMEGGYHGEGFGSSYDLFLGGTACIEGVCLGMIYY